MRPSGGLSLNLRPDKEEEEEKEAAIFVTFSGHFSFFLPPCHSVLPVGVIQRDEKKKRREKKAKKGECVRGRRKKGLIGEKEGEWEEG